MGISSLIFIMERKKYMDHTEVKATVCDQTLVFEELPKIASGGVDEVRVTVTFDALWDGFAKTAVFYRKLGAVYHVPLDDDCKAIVPYEVMKTKGPVYFGVVGENDSGAVRTTEVKQLDIVQGAAIEKEVGYEPAPDIYAEILAVAKSAEKIAQSVRDDADAGMFGGGIGMIPEALPNPCALDINGTSYDGSSYVPIRLMRWMGEWMGSVTYYINDVVSYNGSLYVCLSDRVPDDDVPSDLVSWAYLAKNGETDIPVTLPNPYSLTFTGAVNATYDGSEAVSVEIPSGGSSAWTFLADVTTTEEVAYAAVEITEDVSELYVYTIIPGNSEGLTNNLYAKAWSAAKSLSGYAGEVHVGALGTTTYYYKTTFRKLGEKTDAGQNIKVVYDVNSTGQSYGGKWGDVNGNYFVLSTQYGNDHLPIGTNIIIYGR